LTLSNDGAIDLFPNPTSGEIVLTNRISGDISATIKLYNLQGQLISTLCRDRTIRFEQRLSYNLKDYPVSNGVYLLTISTPERKITRKVIVN
jgi:hypothetical protein